MVLLQLIHTIEIHSSFKELPSEKLFEANAFLNKLLKSESNSKGIFNEALWRYICFVEGFRKMPEGTSIFRFLPLGNGLRKRQLVEESFKQQDHMMASIT